MFIFKSSKKIIWDKSENKVLAKFVDGVFETDDQIVIDKLKKIGIDSEEKPNDNNSSIDKLSIEELKIYAEEKQIDIVNSTSKAGILKKIKEFQEKV